MVDISVIIPCFNAREYIKDTLNSLKNQDFKNFEVICINDGSSDDTLEILNKFEFDKLIVINSSNNGASFARNLGLDSAKGDYICFLDSDDLMPSDGLSLLFKSAKKFGSDLVVGDFSYLKNENLIYQKNINLNKELLDYDEFYKEYFLNSFVSIWAKLYKKDILLKNKIKFLEDVFIAEDLNFNAKFILNCKKISKVNKSIYYYRVGENNDTKNINKKHFDDVKKVCNDLKKYFAKKGVDDKFISYHLIKTRFFAPLFNLDPKISFYDQILDRDFFYELKEVYRQKGFSLLGKKAKFIFILAKILPKGLFLNTLKLLKNLNNFKFFK